MTALYRKNTSINTVSLYSFQVHMNMGNVMGSVDWISKDFRSSARLSIASTGHKKVGERGVTIPALDPDPKLYFNSFWSSFESGSRNR